MPRGGLPDDDLAPTPDAPTTRSPVRVAGSVLAAVVVVGLAIPSAHGSTGPSARRLELVGGPTTTVPAPPDGAADGSGGERRADGSGGDPASSTTTLPTTTTAAVLVRAQGILPVQVLLADPTPVDPTTSASSAAADDEPDGLPIRAERPTVDRRPADGSSSTATTAQPPDGPPSPGLGSTTTTTTQGPQPPPTPSGSTTTLPSPGTTEPPPPPVATTTTTTALPPATTTTSTTLPPATTTTAPLPCTRGVIDPDRSSFVFDGQSNSLSPTPERSYAARLMQLRWPSRVPYYANVAVGGTSFAQRNGWAYADAQIAALGQPCAILLQEGGPTDFANGLSAEDVLLANQRYTQARRAAGFDVIVGATMPPLGWLTPQQEVERRRYNDLLRRYQWEVGLDYIVDVASLPQLQDVNDPRWFYDTTHFTDEAAAAVADLYRRTLP